MRKLLKRLGQFLLVLLLLVGVLGVLVFTTDLMATQFPEEEPAEVLQASELSKATSAPDSLRIMSYNIKFGGARIDFFFDCYGDRVVMTEAEVTENLKKVATLINQLNPDILLLQEVDRGSDRVAGMDQVQFLLDATALNHGLYASQWDAYVPSGGIGRVNSGNAILSKYPLTNGTRHQLDLIDSQGALTRLFYLRRNLLVAQANVSGHKVGVLNTHLSAYASDSTLYKQLQRVYAQADQLAEAQEAVVIGGDWNTLPPGTQHVKDFDDNACALKSDDFSADDYSAQLAWLNPFYERYSEIVPLDTYNLDQRRYYTHTVNGSTGRWNRRVDYLFTSADSGWARSEVYQSIENGGYETFPLSDHAPILGVLPLN